ncbi:MAG: peptide ABC transporter substrate-binding protein [Selenomonadaceae bacterium]|nr:peptide ABC transporter substrate-binding protein [Selenomonadaceae bacterium]
MKKALVLLLMVCLCMLTACGREASPDNLKVMLGSNVMTLDTAQARDSASFELIADCLDGLTQLSAEGNAVPALAESFEVSPDGKTYTFHLRDAKWANGDPVTAADFVFAWRRHCADSGEYSYMMGSTVACVKNADAVIKGADPATLGVSAPDAKTFVVELEAPVSFFPSLMAFPSFYPINEKFYNGLKPGTYGTSPETFLANGAFALQEYLPGTANIRLKKNETYWDAARVSLPELTYQVVGSSDNALTAFKNNTLQMVQISGNQVEHVKKDPKLAPNLKAVAAGSLNYLSFNQDPKNHHAGALANVNLRLALSHAVDRESLVNNYVMDGSEATYTAVPRQFAPNADTGEFFSADQQKFAAWVSFDTEKARSYLAKAKEELGQETFDLELIYASDAGDTGVKVVQALKAQLEENLPGVTIALQPSPKAEYLKNITSNNYDLAVTNWVPDYDDPMTFLNLWTTEGCKTGEQWSNAEYDRIIAECSTGELAAAYAARWEAMYRAEQILLENAVIAPLYTNVNAVLIADNVTGIEFHAAGVDHVYKDVKLK